MLLWCARVWAYPLWFCLRYSRAAQQVAADVDWWTDCIGAPAVSALSRYPRFAYLTGALPEFRTLVHYRLRDAPVLVRTLLRLWYRPSPTLTLHADSIGPALFASATSFAIVTAESIGSRPSRCSRCRRVSPST